MEKTGQAGHMDRIIIFCALLLMALWLSLLILEGLRGGGREGKPAQIQIDMPSFSYWLYRFLLIPPAYTIIEYLETCFRM